MPIPHTWGTIGSHNNKFYIIFKMEYLIGSGSGGVAYNYDAYVLNVPEGNYTDANLASSIQGLLNGFAVTFDFEVLYHPARGTITIEAKPEGMDSNNTFYIPSDFGMMTWMGSTGSYYPWKDSQGNVQSIEVNNLKYITVY